MCDGRNHPLKEIMRTGYADDEQRVVRWCPDCGAIVIDAEFDGRVYPGRVMGLHTPRQPTIQKVEPK